MTHADHDFIKKHSLRDSLERKLFVNKRLQKVLSVIKDHMSDSC